LEKYYIGLSGKEMSEWIRVNKNNPCPICGKPDWCLVAEDGSVAICQRISDGSKRKIGEAGYLHKLTDDFRKARYVPKHKPKPPPVVNWEKLTADYRKNLDMVKAVDFFGLSAAALDDCLLGWDTVKKVHAWPMKDGRGNIIGIRLRTLDGKKFSVPGSKNGLFWPLSVKADSDELLFFPEGPTDTATMLDLGLPPVGRASCGTGYQFIKTMIEHENRQTVVVSDKDTAKYTPDGKVFYPGYDGGLKLARSIKPFVRSVRLIKPPKHKDIRAWYRDGCTRKAVMALVHNAKFI
jgi:hypothetical protein